MIPTIFKLGGLTFNVVFIESIDDVGLGRTKNCLGKIIIATKWYGFSIPDDSQERTFYHELVHSILEEIGYKELTTNEQFVDAFSALLYQFEMTKK
jgi:hypothetical protein